MKNQEQSIPTTEAPDIGFFKFRRANKYTPELLLVYDFFNE